MEKKLKNYKLLKIIEISVFFVAEAAFLLILVFNRTLRTSIFLDKSLFTLCTIMYITVLLVLLMFIIDFFRLRDLKIEDHNLERLAFLDKKTGIPNRTSVNLIFDNYKNTESLKGIGCVVSEIANIKEINEKFGKAAGDRVIADFSKLYEKSADGYGFVGRNGGNDYITIIEKCDPDRMMSFFKRLNEEIASYNKTASISEIDIHSEYVLFDNEEVSSFSELVAKAYKKLGR